MYGGKILDLIRDKDIAALCKFELPLAHPDWKISELIECRQALAFFSKLEEIDVGVDREGEAFAKFLASESECKFTNEVFGSLMSGGLNLLPADCLVLYKARSLISRILGPVPLWDDVKFRFGPGATTNVKRSDACPSNKMAASVTCSYDLLCSGLLPKALRQVPHWTSQHSRWYICPDGWLCEEVDVAVEAGRLQFVPKSALAKRSVIVEPVLNSFFQLGFGDYMTRRLLRAGIDIRDQTVNQRLAREGSLTGGLATLDLSSASDTVSKELVRFLLPTDWYQLLSAFRTGVIRYGCHELVLEKFSSMGNGFTFPLETLIFFSLVRATCGEGVVSVYGDDIICPAVDVDRVIRTLRLCGFTVNTAKSFWAGPFRESCGKDYYKGISVRPFYQKHLVSGYSLFLLHNHYARNLDFVGAERVKQFIHPSLVQYGPDGYGDGHLIGDYTEHPRTKKVRAKGYDGHVFSTFTKTPVKRPPMYPGDWISPLYHVYVGGAGSSEGAPIETCNGAPLWPLPGSRGYRRSLIYTLGR